MAKLSDREEENLVSDWKTGRYSQRDLADKYNCSKGKVSQLTQGIEKAQNGHLVDCQISLLSANAYLSDSEMTAIMTTAQNEVFNKGLVTNATQLNLVRTTQYLANNKKIEKRGVGDGVQVFEEVGLGADDFKQCQDTIDKASITLKVNERHAPRAEVKLTNGDDNSTTNNLTVEQISIAIANGLPN